MSFRNYIVRHDFISEPHRRELLRVMSGLRIDFRATSPSKISPSEIITVTRPRKENHGAKKGSREGKRVRDIYLWWKRRVLFYLRNVEEEERGGRERERASVKRRRY